MKKATLPKGAVRVGGAKKINTATTPPAQATLILPLPPSANAYWRPLVIQGRARMGVTNEARAYKARIKKILNKQWPYMAYGNEMRCCVGVTVVAENLRGDVHNTLKVLFDALQGLVFIDDKIITYANVSLGGIAKNGPGFVILNISGDTLKTPEIAKPVEYFLAVNNLPPWEDDEG